MKFRGIIITFKEPTDVFDPYSDEDRFRKEAFRKIPGVVNIFKSESEAVF